MKEINNHSPTLAKDLCALGLLFFLCSQDSHPRTTARLVNMPVWISTATRTLMRSFIVSRLLIRSRDWIMDYRLWWKRSPFPPPPPQHFGPSRVTLFVTLVGSPLSKPFRLPENGYNIRSTHPVRLKMICVSFMLSPVHLAAVELLCSRVQIAFYFLLKEQSCTCHVKVVIWLIGHLTRQILQ